MKLNIRDLHIYYLSWRLPISWPQGWSGSGSCIFISYHGVCLLAGHTRHAYAIQWMLLFIQIPNGFMIIKLRKIFCTCYPPQGQRNMRRHPVLIVHYHTSHYPLNVFQENSLPQKEHSKTFPHF